MKAFLLIFLAVLLYGVLHSWLASLWLKARARRLLGLVSDRWYRLSYNLLAILTLLPVLALPVMLEDHQYYQVPAPWRFVMLGGQALAALTLLVGLWQTDIWSFLGLRQMLFGAQPKPPRLVVGGLYRWVRHPLYSAGLAFIWLMPVMTRNLLAFNLGITIYIVLGAWLEEQKLLLEFGDAYRQYRRKTAMLIPGFRWPFR